MRHNEIWRGIDQLAERHGLTASGLAKLAGLDATAFNPSKRIAKDGRLRWPSTESLARVLDALGSSLDAFTGLVEGHHRGAVAPLIGFAQAGADGFFDDGGFPKGEGWEQVRFPGVENDEGLYALEISGNSMEPAYREGDRIIVSPNAQVRRSDRVVVKSTSGEVMAKILGRRTESRVELLSLHPDHTPRHLDSDQVAWIARILWVSQ